MCLPRRRPRGRPISCSSSRTISVSRTCPATGAGFQPQYRPSGRRRHAFTQAYANSAVCSATRVALMTGRYQYRLAVGLEEPLRTGVGLPPDHPTLPSMLKRAGYGPRSSANGTWATADFGPLQSGYEISTVSAAGPSITTPIAGTTKRDLWENDVRSTRPDISPICSRNKPSRIDGTSNSEQPFFISLHFNAPHWPWEAPDDEAKRKTCDEKPAPLRRRDPPNLSADGPPDGSRRSAAS